METYRTEQEQVEALRRWWNENGRSMLAAVVIALAAGFGWQAWQAREARQQEQASDMYQALLRAFGTQATAAAPPAGVEIAEQLKSEFGGTTYAQFAALHLAAMAVNDGKLSDAEQQLRWVLGKADSSSDIAQVAQLRLARVLAASGDSEQALAILNKAAPGPYGASYAAVRGDILLSASRKDEARDAYTQAVALAGGGEGQANLPVLQQKLQSLSPQAPLTPGASTPGASTPGASTPGASTPGASSTNDTVDVSEK